MVAVLRLRLTSRGILAGAVEHARRAERLRDAPRGARRVRGGARAADGDAAFLTRLERFFTELRDPLVALYGDDPRFPEQFAALLDAMAATARERDPELRRLDHEREITPDWLQREQAVGYVCYADRFAGTLAGVRERLPYLRELGVNYLHLMPLLARAAGAQRRRLRGRRLRRGRAVAGHDGGPARARRATCTRTAWRCASTSSSTTPRASTRGRGRRWRATSASSPTTARSRTARSPTSTSARCPRSSPTSRPAASRGCRSSTAGCGRRSTSTSGTSTTRTPRCSGRWPRSCSASPTVGVDVLRLDAVPFLWKRKGTDCQNQPEVHQLLQALRARRRGSPRRPSPSRRRRSSRRAQLVTYLGHRPPRGQGVRPRLQQRADGAAVERAGVGPRRADDARARQACRRCRPAPAG